MKNNGATVIVAIFCANIKCWATFGMQLDEALISATNSLSECCGYYSSAKTGIEDLKRLLNNL